MCVQEEESSIIPGPFMDKNTTRMNLATFFYMLGRVLGAVAQPSMAFILQPCKEVQAKVILKS